MTACDFQQALFDLLKKRASQPNRLVSELSGVIYKSKPTIYKKMQGHIGLTVDELIAISHHYQIEIDPLLREAPSYNTIILDKYSPKQNAHEGLLDQLSEWTKNRTTQIMVDVAGPFIHYFHFPELISFLLFNRQLVQDPNRLFSLKNSLRDHELNITASNIIYQYRKVDRVEFWRPYLFDLLLTQIQNCLRTGRFENPRDALRLCNLAESCNKLLKEIYELSRQQLRNRHQVCLMKLGASSNMICVRSTYEHYLYQGLWYRDWTLTRGNSVSERAFENLQLMKELHRTRPNDDNGNCDWFFSVLLSRINQTRRHVEKHLKKFHV